MNGRLDGAYRAHVDLMRDKAISERGATPPNPQDFRTVIRAEQIKALYHAPAIMLVNPLNASILAPVLRPAYPAWMLLLWIGLFCVVVGVRFIDRARYLRQLRENRHEVDWARRFAVGTAATGLLWGLSASVVFVTPDPVAHVVVAFVLGGMTVGAVFQQSAYLPAFFSFALPATVPQVVAYLAKGDRVSIAMSLMLAIYVIVIAFMGRYINRRIAENVQLRFDQAVVNDKLQATIAESKAVLNEIEQIYRYSPVGLCFMDNNYRYVRINEHMAEINGLPVSAHIGRTLREVIPTLADGIMQLYRPIYERGEPVLNAEIRGADPASPGDQRYWLRISSRFVRSRGK
jgi:PAS domain-containing protein